MKKKIASLCAALVLLLTLLPTGGMAAAEPQVSESDLSSLREEILEMLNETYDASVEDRSHYSAEIWTLIQNYYIEQKEWIGAQTDLFELIEMETDDADLAPQLEQRFGTLLCLGAYNKHLVTGSADLGKQKKRDLHRITQFSRSLSRSAYNEFYWQLLQERNRNCRAAVRGAETLTALAAVEYRYLDIFDEEAEAVPGADDESGEEGENEYALDADPDAIYTRSDLENLRRRCRSLWNLYLQQLSLNGADAQQKKQARTVFKQYDKRLKAAYDAMKICELGYACLDAMQKKTGIALQEADPAEVRSLQKQLTDEFRNYYGSDYSQDNWVDLVYIYSVAVEELDNAVYAVQTTQSNVDGVIAEMRAVPTLREEMKTLQKKYIAVLKKTAKKKKYDRRRIRSVVNRGIGRIRGAGDLTDVKYYYRQTLAQAEKCIRTFRVRVKKSGRGTVTGSCRVKYGKSCVLRMKPSGGWRLGRVAVDGRTVRVTKNRCTLHQVRENHTVRVHFVEK
ncbi:MAG: hypothetical protein ACOX41_09965 [Anaerovoracaceae bacterium]|jgi:hypothetical protein